MPAKKDNQENRQNRNNRTAKTPVTTPKTPTAPIAIIPPAAARKAAKQSAPATHLWERPDITALYSRFHRSTTTNQ
jgi:hypothetical protein